MRAFVNRQQKYCFLITVARIFKSFDEITDNAIAKFGLAIFVFRLKFGKGAHQGIDSLFLAGEIVAVILLLDFVIQAALFVFKWVFEKAYKLTYDIVCLCFIFQLWENIYSTR